MPAPTVTFPTSLDSKVKNIGFSLEPEPNHVVFIPDSGPSNTRRRSTFRKWLYRSPVQLNGTDLATWLDFIDDVKDGSEPFYFTDPVTLVEGVWKFRNGSLPIIKHETPGPTTSKTYTMSLVFEKIS